MTVASRLLVAVRKTDWPKETGPQAVLGANTKDLGASYSCPVIAQRSLELPLSLTLFICPNSAVPQHSSSHASLCGARSSAGGSE